MKYFLPLFLLSLITLVWSAPCLGQTANRREALQRLEERLREQLSLKLIDEEEYQSQLEALEELAQRSIRLDLVSEEELSDLPMVSPYQAYQLIKYRTNHPDKRIGLSQLKEIPGWEEETIDLLEPFLAPEGRDERRAPQHYLEPQLSLRYSLLGERRKQATPTLGKPFRQYLNLRYQSSRFMAALSADIDKGEPWRYQQHQGFDHYGFSLEIRELIKGLRVIIGDYRLSWGLGLTIGQGGYYGSTSLSFSQRPRGLKLYLSGGEYEFLRGIAFAYEWGRFSLHGYTSINKHDGAVKGGWAKGYALDLAHRDLNSWQKRDKVTARLGGLRAAYCSPTLEVGLQWLHQDWRGVRLKTPPGASLSPRLSGLRETNHLAIDYLYAPGERQLMLKGEWSKLLGYGWALAQELLYRDDYWGHMEAKLHYYQQNYWALYGKGLRHRNPTNLWGYSLALAPALSPWGYQLEARWEELRKLTERGKIYRRSLRLTARSSIYQTLTSSLSLGLSVRPEQRHQWRLGLRLAHEGHYFSPRLLLSASSYTERPRGSARYGFSLSPQLRIKPSERWWLDLSLALFKAPDWENRLYYYEPRVENDYSPLFLYGKGYRLALRCHYRGKLFKIIDLKAGYEGNRLAIRRGFFWGLSLKL